MRHTKAKKKGGDGMEISVSDILLMQRELQEKYREKWGGLSPAKAREQLLWMLCECGEVIDVIKKLGDEAIMKDQSVRAHFIEEMVDVLMYFGDVLLCYGISPAEFSEAYLKKHARNMKRDWTVEIDRMRENLREEADGDAKAQAPAD